MAGGVIAVIVDFRLVGSAFRPVDAAQCAPGNTGLRVGIARPDTVCVGLYAVEALENQGLWERIRPNLVGYAESCSKTAQMLSLGLVDAVLGWDVFERWDPERIESVPLPPGSIPRVGYIPAAVSAFTEKPKAAAAFVAFLVLLPTTKLRHIFTSPANMFFAPQDRLKGAMKPLPNLMEATDVESIGASVVHEFTWKQLLDSDACTVCGRCTSVCPANLTGKPLDPREIVLKLGEADALAPEEAMLRMDEDDHGMAAIGQGVNPRVVLDVASTATSAE